MVGALLMVLLAVAVFGRVFVSVFAVIAAVAAVMIVVAEPLVRAGWLTFDRPRFARVRRIRVAQLATGAGMGMLTLVLLTGCVSVKGHPLVPPMVGSSEGQVSLDSYDCVRQAERVEPAPHTYTSYLVPAPLGLGPLMAAAVNGGIRATRSDAEVERDRLKWAETLAWRERWSSEYRVCMMARGHRPKQ